MNDYVTPTFSFMQDNILLDNIKEMCKSRCESDKEDICPFVNLSGHSFYCALFLATTPDILKCIDNIIGFINSFLESLQSIDKDKKALSVGIIHNLMSEIVDLDDLMINKTNFFKNKKVDILVKEDKDISLEFFLNNLYNIANTFLGGVVTSSLPGYEKEIYESQKYLTSLRKVIDKHYRNLSRTIPDDHKIRFTGSNIRPDSLEMDLHKGLHDSVIYSQMWDVG